MKVTSAIQKGIWVTCGFTTCLPTLSVKSVTTVSVLTPCAAEIMQRQFTKTHCICLVVLAMSALAIRAVTSGCTTCQGLFLAQKIAVDTACVNGDSVCATKASKMMIAQQ